jgi:hypothetical protein
MVGNVREEFDSQRISTLSQNGSGGIWIMAVKTAVKGKTT